MMKKVLLFLFWLSAILSAMEQEITFKRGDEPVRSAIHSEYSRYVQGVDDKYIIAVEPQEKNMRYTGVDISFVDMNYKAVKTVSVDQAKDHLIEEAFVTDGELHVVLSCQDKEQFVLRHVVYDASSLQLVKDEQLLKTRLVKGEEVSLYRGVSPDEKMHGYVYERTSQNHDNTKAVAVLFDERMEKQWSQQRDDGFVQQVLVTNDGAIVTGGLAVSKLMKDKTALILHTFTSFGVQRAEWVADANLASLALLNYVNDRIVLSVLENYDVHAIRPKNRKTLFPGFHVMVYDMDQKTMITDNYYTFTDEEKRVFNNKNANKRDKQTDPDFLMITRHVTTPQGTAMLIERRWLQIVKDGTTGMSSSAYIFMGCLLVSVDQNGNVLWRRGIMHNNARENDYTNMDLLRSGDMLYVFTNENKKSPDEYTIEKPVSKRGGVNKELVAFTFTSDGVCTKHKFKHTEPCMMNSGMFHVGQGRYYFLVGWVRSVIGCVVLPGKEASPQETDKESNPVSFKNFM